MGDESHALFDIWEHRAGAQWCAQLVNFIGHFKTQEAAQRYVDGVKKHREEKTVVAPKGKKK
jgi:uncharacterized protein (UPF0548 family)